MSNLRKNKIYGNWTVLSINGEEIFKCLEERADWYLSRNLAIKLSDTPPVIKLLFEVKREGNKGDAYYLSAKKNICVKCGTENLEVLTKHHVVPQMYRRFMPIDIKSRNSFDVLPMCFDHHDDYERYADRLKQTLADKYSAPLNGIVISDKNNVLESKAIHSAKAILNHGSKIPDFKKNALLENIRKYCEKADILDEDIEKLSVLPVNSERIIKTHGEIVMEQITDYQAFVEMWRFHFLKYSEPDFMPEHWDPTRSVLRE